MTYESKSFKEHHLTRLPVLERLLLLGWEREQIICPSPNSDDTEWHVPKTPSEATNRESKRSFKGYPVDIALFDDVEFVNDYEHIVAIIECKEPNKNEGISQLKIYLGLEPHARLGIWTNGTEFVRVYKLPSAGDFKVVEGLGLPKPSDNFILAGDKRITYSDLQIPSTRELKSAFSSLLGVITSRDTRSTRREDQLNQMSNILLIKLESDHDGQWDKNESLLFQLSDSPAQTHKSVNDAFADYKRRHPVLFATGEPDSIVLDSDTIQEIVLRLQGMNIGEMAPTALSMAFQVFRDATLKLGVGGALLAGNDSDKGILFLVEGEQRYAGCQVELTTGTGITDSAELSYEKDTDLGVTMMGKISDALYAYLKESAESKTEVTLTIKVVG